MFDADATARDLVENDPEARRLLTARFGAGIFGRDGVLDRARLREVVFSDEQARRDLEEILHPLIRARWTREAAEARHERTWLLLDIPLLYEVEAEGACDAVVTVACREETQRARIVAQRGLSDEMARKMIAAQTSLASKATRADYVIWNDAPLARLDEQVELFAGYLTLWMNNLP